MDFSKYFAQYESLVEQVDGVFKKVSDEHADEVNCSNGCTDCCFAVFDLTFVEALYLKTKFNEKFSGKLQHDIITEAGDIDRQLYKLKRDIVKNAEHEKGNLEIIARLSKARVKCPLFSKNKCLMYDERPIACRVSGIPSSSNGFAHICGLSDFDKGKQYPTLNMDVVYNQLYKISKQLVKDINSKHRQMGDILAPVSMVLITDYNEDYLGLVKPTIIG